MKQTKIIMGTPVIIEIIDKEAKPEYFDEIFAYFNYVDQKFSTYKKNSEISKINNKEINESVMSDDMQEVFRLSEETKNLTEGYFDIKAPSGKYDPSGLVKGWSIWNASKILKSYSVNNFYVEAGGDIETSGVSERGLPWCIGIQNPFKEKREVIKKVYLDNCGMATSGSYVRGDHIYNPHDPSDKLSEVVSLTVIGPNIYEADRFATAAFAMGPGGIYFIESLEGFEGYAINKSGVATMTTGFNNYTQKPNA